MKVVFRRPALEDLDAIADYYQAHSLQTAQRVLADIDDVMRLLETNPFSGREIVATVRQNISKRYRFTVWSRVEGDVVAVLSLHKHQNREANSP